MTRFGADSRARIAAGGLARAAALSGDGRRATELLHDLDRHPGKRQVLLEVEVVQARAWTHSAAGAPAQGAAILVEAAAAAHAGGAYSFEAVLLHDVLRMGNRSAPVLQRLADLAGVIEGPLMAARLSTRGPSPPPIPTRCMARRRRSSRSVHACLRPKRPRTARVWPDAKAETARRRLWAGSPRRWQAKESERARRLWRRS
ncbi:MAG: hypothetical protein ACRDTC_10985 [Pseudonocardiaceae bacterium]